MLISMLKDLVYLQKQYFDHSADVKITFIISATSEGSGELAHARGLARAFTVRTHTLDT